MTSMPRVFCLQILNIVVFRKLFYRKWATVGSFKENWRVLSSIMLCLLIFPCTLMSKAGIMSFVRFRTWLNFEGVIVCVAFEPWNRILTTSPRPAVEMLLAFIWIGESNFFNWLDKRFSEWRVETTCFDQIVF